MDGERRAMRPSDIEEMVAELPVLVPLKVGADFIGVTDRTIRRWAASGRIKVLKTSSGGSGRVLIPRMEIVRILEQMMEA